MTFLLQKFNAINRTRAEARARSSFRSPASGIAFTGRLAACLLLAGFLGVGSAIAQPKVLRVGGGAIKVATNNNKVHHYKIGDADAVMNPTSDGSVSTFLVGGIALVSVVDKGDSLQVSPVAAGEFGITLDNDYTGDLTDKAVSVDFAVVSANAPGLTGIAGDYNAGVDVDVISLSLMPRDNPSKEYTVTSWFSDPNDVFLTYDAKADMVAKTVADKPPTEAPLRPKVDKDGVHIVSATVAGNKLTVTLTKDAMALDQTDIWVFARDGSGGYARKRIQVTVGAATNPYVMTALADVFLREDDATNTTVDLAAGFADPDLGDRKSPHATALTYAVGLDDNSATKVGTDTEYTLVTSYMTAAVTIAAAGGSASVEIRPRAPGSATFTAIPLRRAIPRPARLPRIVAKRMQTRRSPPNRSPTPSPFRIPSR